MGIDIKTKESKNVSSELALIYFRFKAGWLLMGLFASSQALSIDQTKQADDIKMQIMKIRGLEKDTGVRLSGNQEFHDWLMENSS